jgi:hypothetical protein
MLAQATSDNAAGFAAYFTFWFPLGLFVVVGAILWVLYSRPHRRVPPRRLAPAQAGGAGRGSTATGSAPAANRREEPGGSGQPGAPQQRGQPERPDGQPGGEGPGARG